ncbi:MAG: hypothetical protein HY063_09015 [Bacteroidetes bacterium]|nr:hypothetical protein [Bacteroidota bacterium]
MNWKLIFGCSLFGLAMAISTAFFLPGKIEMIFWLAIFLIVAYLVAKSAAGKFFLHGFLISLVNSVWVVSAHILFFKNYMELNPEMWQMQAQMPMPEHPRMMMAIMGPIIGVAFGIILGLFCWAASKMVKK